MDEYCTHFLVDGGGGGGKGGCLQWLLGIFVKWKKLWRLQMYHLWKKINVSANCDSHGLNHSAFFEKLLHPLLGFIQDGKVYIYT